MSSFVLSLAAFFSRILPMPVKRAAYRLGPLAGLLRRLLNRAAPAGLTEVRVAGGALSGALLLLDLQCEKDLWLGTYEPELQTAVKEFRRPGGTAYDVGANVGFTSLLLARAVAPGGRVYAFEPLPANLDRLQRNIALNQLGETIHVIPSAVGDASGRVRFLVHASGAMGKMEGSAGRPETYTDTIEVDCTRLDDFVFERGNSPPGLLKIDIEGGEVLALQGMRRVLHESRPVLFLELHGPQAAEGACSLLARAGYTLRRMQAGHGVITDARALPSRAYLLGLPPEPARK